MRVTTALSGLVFALVLAFSFLMAAHAFEEEEDTFVASWVGNHPDAENWTMYAREATENHGSSLHDGTSDVTQFCPRYHELSATDKSNFWIQLIASIVRYESAYRPEARLVEASLGIDPVTGQRVVSEGLLQLSYQDERNYRNKVAVGVCDFDYPSDRSYPNYDLRRTILDPKTNLTCGVAILNYQVKRYGKIAVSKGTYWSVIQTSSRYQRLPQIKQMTKSLKFCSS